MESIERNEEGMFWGKNWYWQGRRLEGKLAQKRFYLNLEKGNHCLEFWADKKPKLNEVKLLLGGAAGDVIGDSSGKQEENQGEEKKQQEQETEQEQQQKSPEEIMKQVKALYQEIGLEIEFDEMPPVKSETAQFDSAIEMAGKEFDVEPAILKATLAQESNFGNKIEYDDRYVGESGLMGLEKEESIATLRDLGYEFDYKKIEDVIRASAAYYNWARERKTEIRI